MDGVNKVSWYEPWHLSWRRNVREIRRTGLLSPAKWIKLAIISAIVFAVICVAAGLTQGWQYVAFMPWQNVLLAPFLLAAALFLYIAIICAVPTRVEVRKHKLTWTHGDSTSIIRLGDLTKFRIDHFAETAHRLTITGKTTRKRTMTRRFWIRGSVNESELITLLNTLTAQDTALPQHLRA